MAGDVIEAVAGQPIEVVYRERILKPLGMEDTWLECRAEPRAELAADIHPPGAWGIELPGQGEEPFDVTELDRDSSTAGGMRPTPLRAPQRP